MKKIFPPLAALAIVFAFAAAYADEGAALKDISDKPFNGATYFEAVPDCSGIGGSGAGGLSGEVSKEDMSAPLLGNGITYFSPDIKATRGSCVEAVDKAVLSHEAGNGITYFGE